MMRLVLGLAVVIGLAPAASAQDGVFDLDTVLVATFNVESSSQDDVAEAFRVAVEEALADSYLVMGMEDVPAFDDYTAQIYMQGCPPGQYVGCAFVIGGRAVVDWVVAGEVKEAGEDAFELRLSYIDVAESKLLLDFTVTVDDTNRDTFADGVVRVMDSVVSGAVEQLDVRGDLEEPDREREEDDREREELGDDLDEFDEDLGDVERSFDQGIRKRRVTDDQLDEFDDREDMTPWDQIGLSKGSYKRYRNSGKSLEMWDHLARGRFGQVLFSAQVGVGTSPFGQSFEAWYARASTLQIVHQYVLQEQRNVVSTAAEFQVSVGILPWIDLGVFGGVRSGQYTYRFHQEVVGQDPTPRDPEETVATTWQLGGRVGFAPMPTYIARPTVHLGVYGWWGSEVTDHVEAPDFVAVQPRNKMVVLQLSPGGEVNIGRFLLVFARFNMDIPIAGTASLVFENPVNPSEADPRLSSTPSSQALQPGFGGVLGVTVRAPIFSKLWDPRPNSAR